jgi:hypothetical protein
LALKGLMDFDGTHGIPYPLRGPYPLRTREQVGITDPELERAWHLADRAAWGSAARAFAAAAERHPKNGALAYNAGLCLAWSGDQQAAAAALHRAAPLQADFETAVETEALAQLLDESLPEHQTPMFQQKFRVQVASRLLTRLGEHPTFIRTTIPPRTRMTGRNSRSASSAFSIVRRSKPASRRGSGRLRRFSPNS